MERQIATTREQSDRLLKCGVSAYAADMTLSYCKGGFYELMATPFHYGCFNEQDAPTFSLSALLSLLPKEMKADGTTYKLNIDYPPIGQVAIRYNTEDDDLDSLFGLMGDDLFELIVLMGEQLTANGYKLNGIEKGGKEQ